MQERGLNILKKVGLITLYRDNFGSILQAYSTYSFVRSLNYECKIIHLRYSNSKIEKIKKIPSFLFMCVAYRDFFSDRIRKRKSYTKEVNLLANETKKKMNTFVDSVFEIDVCDSRDIKCLNRRYDFFITGSDQVWNGYNDFYFLTFADKGKRIAFAPSFGTNELKAYSKNRIKKALNKFSILSVREESGARIIKELTGKDAIRLADPTVLKSKEEWREFAKNGMKKEDYILIHFLNKPNEIALRYINEYLKKYKCTAYCICNEYEEYNKLMYHKFIDINPYDYVSLINDANYVFTDSFHSTLFSLNLETQFFTFDRQHFNGQTQRSRITDLLDRANMKNRFILYKQETIVFSNTIEWSSDYLFEKERNELKKYILEGIKDFE